MVGEFALEGPLGIDGAAAWITSAPDAVRDHLLTYTSTYTGRWFEWFAERSRPNRFDAEDVLAVGSLSIDIPTEAARTLVADEHGEFSELLESAQSLAAAADAPSGLETMDLDGDLAATLADLYRKVRAVPDVGKVTASKLLAAKFAALVPIRDARVEPHLRLAARDEWRAPLQQLLRSNCVHQSLKDVDLPADRPNVTVLRRLDIVLWREAERRGLR